MLARNRVLKGGRTCGSVTPVGSEGLATVGTLSAVQKLLSRFRTANENELRLSAAICTANIAVVNDGEWALISPYGDHPSPDGSYVQHLDREQAEKIVATWNSITGKAARVFKNMWHGLGAKFSSPVWDGHPETDKQRWPVEKLLSEITDVRAGAEGFEGRVVWTANGKRRRGEGPLFPSALWWHWPPSGSPPAVFPELLESVGLVSHPNISGVPAWTANAHFAGDPQAENQNQTIMNEEQLNALRKALNLPLTADAATIISTANAALQLTTANASLTSAKADLETQLTTANGKVTTLTSDLDAIKTANTKLVTERDELKTANTALLAERDGLSAQLGVLVTGALDLAEKKGVITPAERKAYKDKLATANTAAATFTELQTRKAMNTDKVNINGNRVDLSTANARGAALDAAVAKHQADNKCDYDTAFAAVRANPDFAPLFGAMQDPTKAAA